MVSETGDAAVALNDRRRSRSGGSTQRLVSIEYCLMKLELIVSCFELKAKEYKLVYPGRHSYVGDQVLAWRSVVPDVCAELSRLHGGLVYRTRTR